MSDFDVWFIDTSGGTPTRFTFDPATDGLAVWSPDGRRVVFGSFRNGRDSLYEKSAGGAGDERLIALDAGLPQSWSSDGRFVLFSRPDSKTGVDLWVLPMMGDAKPFVVVQEPFDQRGGEFSPDDRWLVYASNESGRFEVYVRPFPHSGGKWQVSSSGGTQPRWRRDGRELYYLAPDGRLVAVPIIVSPDGKTLKLGVPTPLFQPRLATGVNVVPGRPQYAVAPDGRFLLNTIVEDTAPSPITVVVNWTQLLEAR